MEWTAGWLGQVTLAKVLHNLELVTVEVTGDDQTFGADNNNLLTLEEALGNGGGKATHKVTITIDDFDSVKSVRHI